MKLTRVTAIAVLLSWPGATLAAEAKEIDLDGRPGDRWYFEPYGGQMYFQADSLRHRFLYDDTRPVTELRARDATGVGGMGGLRTSWVANDYLIVDPVSVEMGGGGFRVKRYSGCKNQGGGNCTPPDADDAWYGVQSYRFGTGVRAGVPLRYIQPYVGLSYGMQIYTFTGRDPYDPVDVEAEFEGSVGPMFAPMLSVGSNIYFHRGFRMFVEMRQQSLDFSSRAVDHNIGAQRLTLRGSTCTSTLVGASWSPEFFRQATPRGKALTVMIPLFFSLLMAPAMAGGASNQDGT